MRRKPTEEQKEKAKIRRENARKLWRDIKGMNEEQRAELAARVNVATCDGHILSLRNQCMIALQIATATIVGGFRQWKRQGRSVCKGQHGAVIWVPKYRKNKDADAETEKETLEGFLLATVFDVAQTQEIVAAAA